MSLIEMVIALAILLIVLVPGSSLLWNMLAVSTNTRSSLLASNLATAQLDQLTQAPFSYIESLIQAPVTLKKDVGGTVFTVVQDAQWVGQGSDTSLCNQISGIPQLVRVKVVVSWPAGVASNYTPITEVSTFPPAVSNSSSGGGNMAVSVLGSRDQTQGNVDVTITSGGTSPTFTQSIITPPDGCAFFAFVPVATYTVSIQGPSTEPVWVGEQENTSPTQTGSVTSGNTTLLQFYYDQGAILNFYFPLPTSVAPASNLPISLSNAQLNVPGWVSTPQGANPYSPVYPYSDGYQLWAGNCVENNPNGTTPSGAPIYPNAPPSSSTGFPSSTGPLAPGMSFTVPVTLYPLKIKVVDGSGNAVQGATLSAQENGTKYQCPLLAPQLGMQPSGGGGMSTTGMPLGHFQITAAKGPASGSTDIWIYLGSSGVQVLAEPGGTPISGPVTVTI
ncbi:MAG: hypothetical protein M1483_08610 [Actinobacteria bacterium]|nr:hypothetical protein [Actinomycetota bacterium]